MCVYAPLHAFPMHTVPCMGCYGFPNDGSIDGDILFLGMLFGSRATNALTATRTSPPLNPNLCSVFINADAVVGSCL
jgi:hypothetical protein